jgi:hypothetical protein
MISSRTKEAISYYAGIVTVMLIGAGTAGALVYMGMGLMRRMAG